MSVNFCDNPCCPHHALELNDEKHYHSGDPGVVFTIQGILRTHPINIEYTKTKKVKTHFFFNTVEETITTEEKHLCDICRNALLVIKGY